VDAGEAVSAIEDEAVIYQPRRGSKREIMAFLWTRGRKDLELTEILIRLFM